MGPPKCKTCGITEWRHVCGPKIIELIIETPTVSLKRLLPTVIIKPKTDRKAYLAQKAKERRARQKAAKT